MNDNNNSIIKLINILLGFLYKTAQVKVNTNSPRILFKAKYLIPILKQLEIITKNIKLIMIIDNLLSLLAYQHTYASKGDIIVITYLKNTINYLIFSWYYLKTFFKKNHFPEFEFI